MIRRCALLFATALLASAAIAGGVTAVVDVTVLPMDAERSLTGQTVLIEGDRILAIGPGLAVPEDARVIEGSGKFLMPGLADMHVHLWNTHQHALYLANGVTTVRNMWGAPVHRRWQARAEAGELDGPNVLSTGPLVDGSPPIWMGSIALSEPESAAGTIASQAEAGFTEVKVYSKLTPEVFRAIAVAADEHGMRVVGHVPALVSLEEAFEAGQRGIEHLTGYRLALQKTDSPLRAMSPDERAALSFVETARIAALHADEARIPEVARKTRAWGVWNTPTLLVTERLMADADAKAKLAERDEMRFIAPSVKSFWNPANDFRLQDLSEEDRKLFDQGAGFYSRLVGALHEAGCDLLLGTDAPNPFVFPGFSIHEELERLVGAGLTPFEALRTGTANAARFMGQEAEWGRVAPGLRADLLLLEADPFAQIANTRRIAGVMLRGRWLPRAELERKLESEAAFYRDNPGFNPFAELMSTSP